jgi:hypothetical protein
MSKMKLSIETIVNNLNERLFKIEIAMMENRKAMVLILRKVDYLLDSDDLMSEADEYILDGEPNKNPKKHPDSVYIEECFNQLMESDDGLSSLREFEKELEKYSDEITGMGES